MKVFHCITIFVVLTCVFARRPKGPPKGRPPPPFLPPGGPVGPIFPPGPVGPVVPPGGGGGEGNGGGTGTGTCFVGQADASACESFSLPDASVNYTSIC